MTEKNYKISVNEESGEISFTFNVNNSIGDSKSGKSVLITSTSGNKNVSDLISEGSCSEDFLQKIKDMKIGANIFKTKPRKKSE